MTKTQPKGIPIKCVNPQCRHKWIYKGKSKFYVTCPVCYNKVKREENEVDEKPKSAPIGGGYLTKPKDTTHPTTKKVRTIE